MNHIQILWKKCLLFFIYFFFGGGEGDRFPAFNKKSSHLCSIIVFIPGDRLKSFSGKYRHSWWRFPSVCWFAGRRRASRPLRLRLQSWALLRLGTPYFYRSTTKRRGVVVETTINKPGTRGPALNDAKALCGQISEWVIE